MTVGKVFAFKYLTNPLILMHEIIPELWLPILENILLMHSRKHYLNTFLFTSFTLAPYFYVNQIALQKIDKANECKFFVAV